MGVSDNVINMTNVSSNVFVPSAMDRGLSPLGALTPAGALDEALTDDSLGLTPPKADGASRGRTRSLQSKVGGRPPLTKRSPSWTRKPRSAGRLATPMVLKQLRNASAQVLATDDSVQARLVALEQQVLQDHAYKLELVQVVQGLQVMAASGSRSSSSSTTTPWSSSRTVPSTWSCGVSYSPSGTSSPRK